MNTDFNDSLPMGFAMGLTMDLDAMNRFSNLTEAKKEELLNRARDAKSKDEMQQIIDELSHGTVRNTPLL